MYNETYFSINNPVKNGAIVDKYGIGTIWDQSFKKLNIDEDDMYEYNIFTTKTNLKSCFQTLLLQK